MKLKNLLPKVFKVAMSSVKLISAKTEDGTIVTFDVFEVESPIFSVNEDASVTPLADGEHNIMYDEKKYKIVCADGIITSIEEVVEENPEVLPEAAPNLEETQAQSAVVVDETPTVDEKIKEFEAKLSEKELEISELKLKIEEYEEKLKTALPQPKKNEVKTSTSYIKEDVKARLSAIQSLKK